MTASSIENLSRYSLESRSWGAFFDRQKERGAMDEANGHMLAGEIGLNFSIKS